MDTAHIATTGRTTGLLYPELPPAMSAGARKAMRLFGPGAIVAAVSIGSGETLFASRAGAIFGYGLLWFVILCIGCKLIQVYSGARYMVLSGEHPMEAWARLPGPRAWFPIVIGVMSILCFPFWMGGLAKMLGTAANWIIGIPADHPQQALYASIFGTCTLGLAAGLTLWQTYAALEKAQTIIVGVLLASILAAVAAAPVDWSRAFRGLVTLGGLSYPDWIRTGYPDIWKQSVFLTLALFMGAIGGGTQDYIGYLGFFREKRWGGLGWRRSAGAAQVQPDAAGDARIEGAPNIDSSPANVRTGRRWLRAPMIDVYTGFLCVMLFTMAFNLLGASILNRDQKVPEKFALLSHQVEFLTQLGLGFALLYKLGIITAFWANIYGALEVYSRTTYECLLPVSPRVGNVPFSRFRLAVCLYAGLGGIALMWSVPEPVKIVEPAAYISTVACGLWCFATVWADRRFLPPGLRMNAAWVSLNVLAGGILTVCGSKAVIEYVQSL